mmetsp:Transcript_39900/g.106599  ORF Transcript_39900/g.106599 Transcript_39900/m.106599 type:complete len:337 (+) Transcript_39900:217-1227(+)
MDGAPDPRGPRLLGALLGQGAPAARRPLRAQHLRPRQPGRLHLGRRAQGGGLGPLRVGGHETHPHPRGTRQVPLRRRRGQPWLLHLCRRVARMPSGGVRAHVAQSAQDHRQRAAEPAGGQNPPLPQRRLLRFGGRGAAQGHGPQQHRQRPDRHRRRPRRQRTLRPHPRAHRYPRRHHCGGRGPHQDRRGGLRGQRAGGREAARLLQGREPHHDRVLARAPQGRHLRRGRDAAVVRRSRILRLRHQPAALRPRRGPGPRGRHGRGQVPRQPPLRAPAPRGRPPRVPHAAAARLPPRRVRLSPLQCKCIELCQSSLRRRPSIFSFHILFELKLPFKVS